MGFESFGKPRAARSETDPERNTEANAEVFAALDNAGSLEELAELIKTLDEGDGHFVSDAGAGKLPVEKTAQDILAGHGRNVSDSRIQKAVSSVERKVREARSEEATRLISEASTTEELIAAVKSLDNGQGRYSMDVGGEDSISRTIEIIQSGGGGDVPDSRIQQAARRIARG